MYSFTLNLDLFSPSKMALESDLFRLLLSIEDDNNQMLRINLPFATTKHAVQHSLGLMTTTDRTHTLNYLMTEDHCYQVLYLLDFLGASAAVDRVFALMVVSNTATLHTTWTFIQALTAWLPRYDAVFDQFVRAFAKQGLTLNRILRAATPRKARHYIRSSLRAASWRLYDRTFVCPFCTSRFHFDRDCDKITQTHCCGSRIHLDVQCVWRYLNAWNCVYCDCQIDIDGNMLWPDTTQAEGSRFHIRAKRGVAPYAMLPNLALWQIVAEGLRDGPFAAVP